MVEATDNLVITFPARAGYLSICRLNVTAMAATAGFDVDALDDLRLAVNEAVTWLLQDEGEAGGVVELAISADDGLVEFRGIRSEVGLAERPIDDLAGAILGATVDSIEHGTDERGRRFIELSKRVADG